MLITFSIVAGISLIFGVYGVAVAFAAKVRIQRYAEKVDSMEVLLPQPKMMELQQLFNLLKSEFDDLLVQFDKHKDSTYRQVQRNDNVMRRNEKAADVVATADPDDETLPLPQHSDSIPVSPGTGQAVANTQPRETVFLKQTRLRAAWKKNRGIE